MKTKLLSLLLLCFTFFVFVLSSDAAIRSTGEIYAKKAKLQTLSSYDFMSFVNKNELIGYRFGEFNMASSQYKNSVSMAIDSLNSIIDQIKYIENSADYSNSDKQVQISRLYQDADSVLYDLDSKTITYLTSVRDFMPTLTYSRFVKKFQTFYNQMQFTTTQILIK